ncbi:hypothetical protein RXV86_15155 [Alisedimentitalea sp. MJ-SS2]|uniref:hypothetical protein n=1 Tax=Aliisedimentitalea sp. MJ-SS2 TaxID=3049795 RepID=UPI0029085F81|nr:hypothetical protein [Alisedimentitalea sp. MJ-SS2]MDU8928728.1 hypothetical protein [Alisedimentitalea sp. MJ-SS2]
MAMNLWTVPKIEALSGGLRLLDMRFAGYSFAQAQDFLAAIGDQGAALYLGAQFWLDMVFPPLLGAVLFFTYRWLFPGWPGLIIGAISLSYVAVDLLENLAIAAMLRVGAENITVEMAATANQWTIAKWSLALVGLVTLVVGLLLLVLRRKSAT